MAVGQAVPVMYVEIDGTGGPVVAEETQGRVGKRESQRAHISFRRGSQTALDHEVPTPAGRRSHREVGS
jgi:hypothetical protein